MSLLSIRALAVPIAWLRRRWFADALAALVLSASILALAPVSALAAGLILNEYNAVAADQFLNGGSVDLDEDGGQAADPAFGRVAGNGGDWFELVVTQDGLDVRGWRMELAETDDPFESATLVFSQAALLSDLSAGTILTIAEDVAEDVGYLPVAGASGDWWIQLQAGAGGPGAHVSAVDFPVSNKDWQLTLYDADGLLVYGPVGEGISPGGGVNSREVWKLEDHPRADVATTSPCMDDGTTSTFGAPNRWGGGESEQDFSGLREGAMVEPICGPQSDPTAPAFDPERLLEVSITLDPAEWDALRRGSRDILEVFGGRCGDQPIASPFEFASGTVRVDGVEVENAGVRKKGFFGSIDSLKPSLKIRFDEFEDGQEVYGLDRLTLNNARQDPSLIEQCLGYGLFRAAGLPAPRCSFARVTVNGEDLGVYVHVESIKDPFLVANFGSASGNLYEGTTADFRENFIGLIEGKNSEDFSDVEALRDALQIEDDAEMLTAVEALVDLDRFFAFWAMEGLIGHWDGYAGNANNWWLYDDPTTGLFEFIPWSLDDTFGRGNPLASIGSDPGRAPTVHDRSRLTQRLWRMPEMRTRYKAQLDAHVAAIWDVEALLAEVDRMEALVTPYAGDLTAELAPVRAWIAARASHIAEDFAEGPPELGWPLMDKLCLERNGRFEVEFTALWNTMDLFTPLPSPAGTSVDLEIIGTNPPVVLNPFVQGVIAGVDEASGLGLNTFRFAALDGAGTIKILNLAVGSLELAATEVPQPAGDEIANLVLDVFVIENEVFTFPRSVAAELTVHFSEVDLSDQGEIKGVITGTLADWVPHPVPEPGAFAAQLAALGALGSLARQRASRRRR